MQIEVASGTIQELDVQALAVAVFKDEKADDGFLKELDGRCSGMIKSVVDGEELKGKEGETVFLHLSGNDNGKARRILLVGVGERSDYTRASVSEMAGTAVRSLRAKSIKSIGLAPRFDG